MKRYIILLFSALLLPATLCGCQNDSKNESNTQSTQSVVIRQPTDNTVNGYRTQSSVTDTPDTSGTVYYANKSSKKFHSADCTYAKSINEENCYKTENRDKLILDGYSPCKSCNP